jgi:hypothetical protein
MNESLILNKQQKLYFKKTIAKNEVYVNDAVLDAISDLQIAPLISRKINDSFNMYIENESKQNKKSIKKRFGIDFWDKIFKYAFSYDETNVTQIIINKNQLNEIFVSNSKPIFDFGINVYFVYSNEPKKGGVYLKKRKEIVIIANEMIHRAIEDYFNPNSLFSITEAIAMTVNEIKDTIKHELTHAYQDAVKIGYNNKVKNIDKQVAFSNAFEYFNILINPRISQTMTSEDFEYLNKLLGIDSILNKINSKYGGNPFSKFLDKIKNVMSLDQKQEEIKRDHIPWAGEKLDRSDKDVNSFFVVPAKQIKKSLSYVNDLDEIFALVPTVVKYVEDFYNEKKSPIQNDLEFIKKYVNACWLIFKGFFNYNENILGKQMVVWKMVVPSRKKKINQIFYTKASEYLEKTRSIQHKQQNVI